jgi:hypothetical protein
MNPYEDVGPYSTWLSEEQLVIQVIVALDEAGSPEETWAIFGRQLPAMSEELNEATDAGALLKVSLSYCGTESPTAAREGGMLSMRAAWAAGVGHARTSSPTAKVTTVVTSNPAKPGAELGFLSITLKRVFRMKPWETAPGIGMGVPPMRAKWASALAASEQRALLIKQA